VKGKGQRHGPKGRRGGSSGPKRGSHGRRGERPSQGRHSEGPSKSSGGGTVYVGRVQKNPRGFAFIIPKDKKQEDAYVPRHDAQILLSDDIVEYRVHREGRRMSAEIVRIVERGQKRILGMVRNFRGDAFLETPHGEKFDMTPAPHMTNHWAIAEVVGVPTRREPAIVSVREDLGEKLTPEQDYQIGIAQFNLPFHFSPAAIRNAEEMRAKGEKEIHHLPPHRKDLRDLDIVTIDGEDAKDFDDAVYVEKHEKGGYTLYVSIADVSFYVKQGTPLDQDAVKRSTSVYFPGYCLPMLPEIISNDLCSLRPKEDKLSVTAEIEYDRVGNVVDAKFYESLIKTKARLTYTQVHAFFESDPKTKKELDFLEPALSNAYSLYKMLKKKRAERGVLEFDLGETKMEVDKKGKPLSVYKAPHYESHQLIEEFMIAANSAVAKAIRTASGKALYRVHETPDEDKLEDINMMLKSLGVSYIIKENTSRAFAAALAASHNVKGAHALHQMILRAQKQAIYAPEAKGHFGLALRDYAHFTSPIRRYPDLVVHRALKQFILRVKNTDNKEEDVDYHALGETTSERERRAAEAERFVTRRKQCWFMEDYIGDSFDGVICGVVEKGLFVEIVKFAIEGFIPVETLEGMYEYDERRMCLRKRPGHTVLQIGDPLRIKVEEVSPLMNEITLSKEK
jgi:ribonuclease R